jgi:hypothetical protein
MGLSSLRPKKKSPTVSPAAAMTELDHLRARLRAAVEQAVGRDLDGVLGWAEVYGWDHLLAHMTADQWRTLVEKMATAMRKQRQVILAVANAYDSILAGIGNAADAEIKRLEAQLRGLRAAHERPRGGPGWLTVALAGLSGYWLGNRR